MQRIVRGFDVNKKHSVRKRDDEITLEQSRAANKAPMSSQRKVTLTLAMKLEAARKAALMPFDMLHQTTTRENIQVVLDWAP